MKLIIAGTRNLHICKRTIGAFMSGFGLHPTEIVSGNSGTVDLAGEEVGKSRLLSIKRFPADWEQYGRAAGPYRNREMAKYADVLLLIWDGKSRGSCNMRKEMMQNHKLVYEIIFPQ